MAAVEEDQHKRADEDKNINGRLQSDTTNASATMSRKLKRKLLKKEKRKQARREAARREREEGLARLNDPEEQMKLKMMEQEEAERMERDMLEFKERERRFLEALEHKMKLEEMEQEEQEHRKLEESHRKQAENKNPTEPDEGSDWEYVEEGPAEIIWQGNEITVRKRKVKVPKKKLEEQSSKKDFDRPISNPLAPQSEAFDDFKSARELLDSVAQQVPNFGTEQDKAHCPFHLKTGACRFGTHCSRVHFYPDKSCTFLLKNMYSGPGLAWEQDEGLECTEEEIERGFEDFYEDVHTEFLKFGEIVNFKVCSNGSPHLRGNVYVHYKSLESAVLANHSINGRYFAGKQVTCEFVNVTKWKVAICGEFMKSKFKTCSRGSTCNFIHCFRNPGGDYEWADFDKPPPRYWVRKMTALFGYKGEYDNQLGPVSPIRRTGVAKTVTPDRGSYHSRRSRSRELEFRQSRSYYEDEQNTRRGRSRHGSCGKEHSPDRDTNEDIIHSERTRHSRRRKAENYSGDEQSDGNRKNERYDTLKRRHKRSGRGRHNITHDTDSETDMFVRYDHMTDRARQNRSLDRDRSKNSMHDDYLDSENSSFESDKGEGRKREKRYSRSRRKDQKGRGKHSNLPSQSEDSYSECLGERLNKDDKVDYNRHRVGSSRIENDKLDLIECNIQDPHEDHGNRARNRKRGRDEHGKNKRQQTTDERATRHHSKDLLIHGSGRDLQKHSSEDRTKEGKGRKDSYDNSGGGHGGRVNTRRLTEAEAYSYNEDEHRDKGNDRGVRFLDEGGNEENVEGPVFGETLVDLSTEEKAHRNAAVKKLEEKKRAKEKFLHKDSGEEASAVGEVSECEKVDIHSRKRLRI